MLTRDSKRECATCHLDWTDSFDRPGAILLMDRPAKPAAAEEPMCLDCHDGSVGDSRRGVWLEHGHRRGAETPSEKVKIPERMPTEDGKMVCRTCHTAHTVPGANDIAKIVFLRFAKDGGLCQQCHVDRAYGQEHGSHPLAKLPFDLPKPIYDAHGRMDIADKTKMACQTCHSAHGATQEHLLVMSTQSGQLCKTCHEQLRPMEWKVDAPREHPQNPKLQNPQQKQAVLAMGTRLGPDDTLTCFTCHKMHDGKSEKYMLAAPLKNSELCLKCHEDRKIVADSKHNLAVSRPADKNRMGKTPAEAGLCGSCHSFHKYARDVKPGAGDPIGRCITCHQPRHASAVAEEGPPRDPANPDILNALGFAHPPDLPASKIPATANVKLLDCEKDPAKKSLACATCHDPHDASKTLFLRKPKDQICSTCHTDRFEAMGGSHDFTAKPEMKNARGWTAQQAGKCGFCHAVHGENDLVLWVGTKDKPSGPDDLCLQCHKADGLAAKKPAFAYNHVTGPAARPRTTAKATATGGVAPGAAPDLGLPLYNERALPDKNGFVSCASCHDPHVDSRKQKEMLRVQGATSDLCAKCHADYAAIAGGPHDPRGKDKWPIEMKRDKGQDLCSTCHTPHSNDTRKRGFAFVPAEDPALLRADAACVTCHGAQAWAHANSPAGTAAVAGAAVATAGPPRGGAAPAGAAGPGGAIPVGRAMHPTTLPAAGHKGAEGSGLPLYAAGRGMPNDRIACLTCHNPHSAKGTPKMARGVAPGGGTQEVCVKCHTETAHLANGMHAADALAAALDGVAGKAKEEPKPAAAAQGPGAAEPTPAAPGMPFTKADLAGRACAPCHSTHAVEGSQRKLLWAAKPSEYATNEADARCLSCHDPDAYGPKGKTLLFNHPVDPLRATYRPATQPSEREGAPGAGAAALAAPGTPEGAGLVPGAPPANPKDAVAALLARKATQPLAEIRCATCHTPHGGVDADEQVPLPERRAARPMVRTDVSQNCAHCHGVDAPRFMLYWHEPQKRKQIAPMIRK